MIKEMTIEEYNENKKICLFVFKKYFRGYSKYKEDLIQCGLINISRHIETFNEEKSKISTFKINYARYGMLSFLRSESLVKNGKDDIKTKIATVSFDAIAPGTDNFKFLDTIEDKSIKNLCYNIVNRDCLRQCIDNVLKRFCCYKAISLKTQYDYKRRHKVLKGKATFNQKKYDILNYYLQCQNIVETAKQFNVSKQLVSLYKREFAKCLKDELVKNGYFD